MHFNSEDTTKLVAIINVTPDSFSDGGKAFSPDDAIKYAAQCLQDGADIIDVGAESTRPGATPISAEEEWRRLHIILPAIIAIAKTYPAKVSLDTRYALTAERGLECGVDLINDVSGFADRHMIDVVKGSSCQLVITHSLSVPADVNKVINNTSDVIEEIINWFDYAKTQLSKRGVDTNRMICDPGIGFGKTATQSLTLLSCAGQIKDKINAPLFIGHSRKSYCNAFVGEDITKRDMITCAFSSMLMLCEIDYLRVHNIPAHTQVREMLRGK
jgi:dihydropteroate synthase